MWLKKDYVMNDFADQVKKGNYKKIDYQTWRELKQLPEEWDLDIAYDYNNYKEEDCSYVVISWDGCDWPYEFSVYDDSLGEYIYNLIRPYKTSVRFDLDSCTMSDGLKRCA